MRVPLLGVFTSFALGIVLADRLLLPPGLLGAALAVSCVLVFSRARAAGEAGVAFFAGALALSARLHGPVPAPPEAPMLVRALEAPVALDRRCRLLVATRPAGRALLETGPAGCPLLPGSRALVRAEPRPFRSPGNPGARDLRRIAARRGIHARLRVREGLLVAVAPPPRGPAAWLERARRRLGDALDPAEVAEPRGGALLRALITGVRGRLDSRDVEAFRRSGTAHLLAVSGLHVGWVFAIVRASVATGLAALPSLRVLRLRGAVGTGTGALAALAYALLTGAGVPALRAATMGLVGALAVLGGRPAASANALFGAGLGVLALDPAALFEPAFALSFSAVLGILCWRVPPEPSRAWLHATLAASLATAPWMAAIGGVWPLGGVLANALAVPLFAGALVPLGLGLAAASVLAPDAFALPLAATRALARGALALVAGLESPDLLRGAVAPAALGLGGAALGFGLRALALRSTGLGAAALALGVAAGAVCASRPAQPEVPEIHVLDVGQGDAVLVRSAGRAWLVDAGGRFGRFDAGQAIVAPALRALGIAELEALVLTHSDADHVGGAVSLLRSVPARELWLGAVARRQAPLRPVRAEAARRGTRLRLLRRGEALRLGAFRAKVVWPPAGFDSRHSNERSLVIELRTGASCVLLPGDLPSRIERRLAAELEPCGVLKLGHHGSATSSSAAWLDALAPEVGLVSAGRRGRSPLPHRDVRARALARDVTLWETSRAGALRIAFPRAGPVVTPYRRHESADGGLRLGRLP